MNRKVINLIIAVVMFVSSFGTLYVCVNITSLTKELNNYMQGTPYAPVIRIGDMGLYSRVSMGLYKEMNRLNGLVYYLAGEANASLSEPSIARIPVLTDIEVASISKLKGIKCAFNFDGTDLIRNWTVRASFGKGEFVYPLTSQYLKALHPPLKEGRYFEEGDPLNVLLVREDYVTKLGKGSDILGKSVTVYTRTGTEQFTVIGVLARIPSTYDGSMSLPSAVVVPYRPGRESSYARGDGKIIPRPPQPQLWIIPQEGHEQQLLSGIQKILGTEKYRSIVSSSTWEFENSFGVQVRRERIAALAASSALTILIGMLTIGSLIYVDISSRKRELGIRRTVGATIGQIAREYATHLLCLLGLGFLVATGILALVLPSFTRFNALGEFLGSYRSPADVLPLHLSASAILLAFGFLAVLITGVTTVLVHQALKGTPAGLLASPMRTRESRARLIALALVIVLSVAAVFTSLSLMTTLQETTRDLMRDTPQQTTTIGPSDSTVIYTVDDYDAVRKALWGKALVGCRKTTPMMSSISLPSGGVMDLRVAGATEDFPAIYDMKLESGRFLTDAESGKCVVGAAVASSMGLRIGDTFMGDEIAGILKPHSSLIDRTAYVPVSESSLFVNPGGLSIRLLVRPLKGMDRGKIVKTALDLLEQRHPGTLRGSSGEAQDLIDAVIRSREGVYGLLSVFTLFSFLLALLYLSATFLIEGIQRTREIGIRRAVGAEQKTIQREFLWKGLRIGLTALGIGVCVGSLMTFVITKKEGMTFSLRPGLLFCFVLASCACLFLSLYVPARNASRITPAEALRRE